VVDTAGLREALDEVEKIGVERAWVEIQSADAVLFLHDLTQQFSIDYIADDARISCAMALKLSEKTPVIDIWNKSDMAGPEAVAHRVATGHPGVVISAKTGAGLQALREQLLGVVGWQSAPEGVFMARERHVRALAEVDLQLQRAAAQLRSTQPALDLLAEDLRQAQRFLGDITGQFTSDDLLGEIFSRFCIGK
jgi:tRNA modification GTPase